MQRRDINAADAPAPAGQYTQAVRRNAHWRGGICRRNTDRFNRPRDDERFVRRTASDPGADAMVAPPTW